MKLTLAAVTLLWCFTAFADDAQKRASELNTQAMKAFDVGENEKSAALLKQAYEIFPEPDILYNLGRAYRSLKQYDKAIDTYKTYLRKRPSSPYKAAVQKLIKEMEDLQKAQDLSNQKPPTDMVPAPQPAPVPPPMAPPPEELWYEDVIGWSLVGAGLVGVGVGTGLHLSANGLESDLATAPETDKQAIRDTISSRRAIGTGGLVVGSALIIVGVVKFVVTGSRGNPEPTHAQILVGPGFLGVAGRF